MDNEWQEFFNEFGDLLNKHHFMVSEFVLGRVIDERIKIVSFNSDWKKVFPVYDIPEELVNKKNSLLNFRRLFAPSE